MKSASKVANSALNIRLKEAEQLVRLHEEFTGGERGRRHAKYDVLSRSAVVLTIAAWEGFMEDLVQEAATIVEESAKGPSALPGNVSESMISYFHQTQNWGRLSDTTKRGIWGFAGRGWRKRYNEYVQHKVTALATPSPDKLRRLFSATLGLANLHRNWHAGRWGSDHYIKKLTSLLTLRHKIAHGNISERVVYKTRATEGIRLIRQLAGWSGQAVDAHVQGLVKQIHRRSKSKK